MKITPRTPSEVLHDSTCVKFLTALEQDDNTALAELWKLADTNPQLSAAFETLSEDFFRDFMKRATLLTAAFSVN